MSEERLVRMALQDSAATQLDFDLAERSLTIHHADDPQQLLALLAPLGCQASIVETVRDSEGQLDRQEKDPARPHPPREDHGNACSSQFLQRRPHFWAASLVSGSSQ